MFHRRERRHSRKLNHVVLNFSCTMTTKVFYSMLHFPSHSPHHLPPSPCIQSQRLSADAFLHNSIRQGVGVIEKNHHLKTGNALINHGHEILIFINARVKIAKSKTPHTKNAISQCEYIKIAAYSRACSTKKEVVLFCTYLLLLP